MNKKDNNIHTSGWQVAILFFFIGSIIFSNCKKPPPPPPKDFTKLNWLIGKWNVGQGSYYARWYHLNDSTFFGRHYSLYGQDTFVKETFELMLRKNEIYLIPTVKTPQGNKAIPFQMTAQNNQVFVFENPKNSYPKKFSYVQLDEMTAKTIVEGAKRKIEYDYKKIE